jgi:hypothetical protein
LQIDATNLPRRRGDSKDVTIIDASIDLENSMRISGFTLLILASTVSCILSVPDAATAQTALSSFEGIVSDSAAHQATLQRHFPRQLDILDCNSLKAQRCVETFCIQRRVAFKLSNAMLTSVIFASREYGASDAASRPLRVSPEMPNVAQSVQFDPCAWTLSRPAAASNDGSSL